LNVFDHKAIQKKSEKITGNRCILAGYNCTMYILS